MNNAKLMLDRWATNELYSEAVRVCRDKFTADLREVVANRDKWHPTLVAVAEMVLREREYESGRSN